MVLLCVANCKDEEETIIEDSAVGPPLNLKEV